eukprot:g3831.t1
MASLFSIFQRDSSDDEWEPEKIKAFSKTVYISEGSGENGLPGESQLTGSWHGDYIWPASSLLQSAFEKEYSTLENKRILELGSGTGVLGLALAAGGAHITMTDLPENCALIRENVNRNISLSKHIDVQELLWHVRKSVDTTVESESGYDYIIAADCIYSPEVALLLFSALFRAASISKGKQAPRIIVANVGRFYKGVLKDIKKAGFRSVILLNGLSKEREEMIPSSMLNEVEWSAMRPCKENSYIFECLL